VTIAGTSGTLTQTASITWLSTVRLGAPKTTRVA